GEVEHTVEQNNDALFDCQGVEHAGLRDVSEQPSLLQIRRGVGGGVHEADGAIALRRRRIAVRERAAKNITGRGEPVAAIAVAAHRAPLVTLQAVVERDDGGIRHEWPGAVVLDHDRSPRKDEAVLADGPGIPERRMAGGAAERADRDAVGREHDPIRRPLGHRAYSTRSARIGSTRAARRAGTY